MGDLQLLSQRYPKRNSESFRTRTPRSVNTLISHQFLQFLSITGAIDIVEPPTLWNLHSVHVGHGLDTSPSGR